MPETKEILKKVKKIEIKTKNLVDGLLQGAYHSVFRGRGIEFSEVREYVPGDDIRTIDWNVTARFNTPYVKEFIEERDLTVYIALDVSSSCEFGCEKAKKDAGIELAASLMFAALRNNDNVGLIMFTDTVETFIPARKGRKHVLKCIRQMVENGAKHKVTDLQKPIGFLSKVLKKKAIIFILSDFIAEDNYRKDLRILRNKHDVIAVNLSDVREHEIPDIGYIQLEDGETGEQLLIDTSDKDFQENYQKIVAERQQGLYRLLQKLMIDMIELRSDEQFEVPLRKFFYMRQRRMVR